MGKKFKLPLEIGLPALCNHIKAIRTTAEQSGSAVAALAESTAASLEEIDNLFDAMEAKNQAILNAIDTLATSLVKGSACVQMQTSNGVALSDRNGQELAARRVYSEPGQQSAEAANQAVMVLACTVDAYRRDYLSTVNELANAILAR